MTEQKIPQFLDLRGKVAIVTGAAGLLGKAMSHGLAEAGAKVAVTSRSQRRANGIAEGISRFGL